MIIEGKNRLWKGKELNSSQRLTINLMELTDRPGEARGEVLSHAPSRHYKSSPRGLRLGEGREGSRIPFTSKRS